MPVLVSRGAVQLTGYIDTMIASLLPDRRGHRADQRADPLHAAGQPVRHRHLGLRAAGDVGGRGARPAPGGAIRSAVAPDRRGIRAHGVLRRPVGGRVRGARRRDRRRAAADRTIHRRPTPATSGPSSPDRRSACSRPRWRGCIRWRTTRWAIRSHRCGSPLLRLVIVTTLGYLCAIVLPPALRIAPHWGAAGLTASAGVAGWIEFVLLRASLNRRIGETGLRGRTRRGCGCLPREPGWRRFSSAGCCRRLGPSLPARSCSHSMARCISGWPRSVACRCPGSAGVDDVIPARQRCPHRTGSLAGLFPGAVPGGRLGSCVAPRPAAPASVAGRGYAVQPPSMTWMWPVV